MDVGPRQYAWGLAIAPPQKDGKIDYSKTYFNTSAGDMWLPPSVTAVESERIYHKHIEQLDSMIRDLMIDGHDDLALAYTECKRKIQELLIGRGE